MGQEQSGARQLADIHADSALVEIDLEHVLDGTFEIVEGPQEIGQAGVAESGLGLGLGDLVIDHDGFVVRQLAHEAQYLGDGAV